jgi:hypothetical protein
MVQKSKNDKRGIFRQHRQHQYPGKHGLMPETHCRAGGADMLIVLTVSSAARTACLRERNGNFDIQHVKEWSFGQHGGFACGTKPHCPPRP